ncbi:MAG: GtrA family protein [bacterium]|nr:GtrA family protein [bacterium]
MKTTVTREARMLTKYAVVGASGVVVYLGLVWLLARAGWAPLLATILGYLAGATWQFVLNRHLTFRAFDRHIGHQAGTYGVVMVVNFVLTVAVVAFGVHVLRLSTFAANLLQLPVTFPTAYLANRYLTFGPGIAARVRALVRRPTDGGGS